MTWNLGRENKAGIFQLHLAAVVLYQIMQVLVLMDFRDQIKFAVYRKDIHSTLIMNISTV